MSKILFIHEIFEACQKAETIAERVDILKENANTNMEILAQAAFNESVEFELPDCEAPYTPNPNMELNSLKQIPRLINCLKSKKIPWYKKESHYLMLLEALTEKDALVVEACVNKRLEEMYPNLKKELFQLSFPRLAL